MSAETAKPPTLAPGASIAPGYAVVSLLNRSKFLDVYEAWSDRRACRCIAKMRRPDRRDDDELRSDLVREGRLLQRLTHPHIVRAYEVIEGPEPVIILETLTGKTFRTIFTGRTRRLPSMDILYLGLHLCSAVRYLHGEGILHLDITPMNIVNESGVAKVIDLSQARPPGPGRAWWGTQGYMAPEQFHGGHFTPATDVWGIGTILYEASTGRKAFAGADEEPRDPCLLAPVDAVRAHRRLPRVFAEAIDRCLMIEPAARPALDELFDTLRRLVP